jgi:hypothetical protein
MDFLQLLWLEFPELQKVIRTHHLPLDLAIQPLELVSWLLCMRKIGVSLEAYPHTLSQIFESLGSPCSVATFTDDGPPMIGCPAFVHQACSHHPCEEEECECYPPCSSFVPPRYILDIDANFDVTRHVILNDKLAHLSSLTVLVHEYPETTTPQQLRYLPEQHGRVLVVKEDPRKTENNEVNTATSDNQSSISEDMMSLSDYLISLGELTTPSTEPTASIFDPPVEDQFSDITTTVSDGDSTVEVSWKRRPWTNLL